MGLFMGSIKCVAGDYETTSRYALVNLTNDDGNANKREKLTTCRIVGIGRKYVKVQPSIGKSVLSVLPNVIQRVW